jgi:uncharacterized protein (UPF0276 family)
MEFATPISHLFEDPQSARRIASASDCLECRDHTVENGLPGQRLFHCDKEIVHPWTNEDRAYIERMISSKPDLRLISFHMASCCSHPKLVDGVFQPDGEMYSRDDLKDFASDNVRWLKEMVRQRGIEIAVENNNYYPTAAYEHITDGKFIKEVVEGCGIGFLFDIAHARVTAHNRGFAYADYLAALPMGRMIQVHVSQHAINQQGMAFDAHILPQESLYQDMGDVVDTWKPQYLTVEFYKNTDELIGILQRCREKLGYENKQSRT